MSLKDCQREMILAFGNRSRASLFQTPALNSLRFFSTACFLSVRK